MPENESINIDITGDVTEVTSSMEHALLSVEQVEEAAQRLTAQLAQIRTLTENPISLFDQDLATQIDLAERSANRLLDIRRNIDNSMSAESRESNTALLGNMITYTKQRVSDLNASVHQMNELQRAMGDLDASDFNQAMKTLYSGLKIGLRQYAEAMSKATGTQTPNATIQGFMKTPEYKNVMAKAQSSHGNQHIFNDQNMQKYLASIATIAISPLTNNDYVDWTGQRRTINRVADLLPKQFSNIKLGRVATPTRDTTSSDFSEKLTKQELNTLQKIILQNQYVAREAEAARLITKHNGSIFMNKDATRGHINAFAGNIAHLFSLGAMGLPMYGIEDIYDPKHLNSIASKTNKTITNARNMANILSEQYGEWLDPAYYSTLPDLPQNASSWYRAGQVKASGRKDRMQFLELALGEVGSDGQITFVNGEPKYTPVVQSEYQNYLSKQKGATPFTHNGQNENEVFVKLPDEEAIQAVLDKDPTKETAIADEIARVIGTRISHNGKNYSFSGLTKTHAIFTDESIKQEIEKHDPNFFANGESARVFDDYEAFAKAATYNRLQRVEGEDIAELYGVDLDKLNVVVGNFKSLTGLDGQNFISNKLVPEGFQGRSFGGKATYSPFSVEWLFKQYANFVDTKSGNLILPGANVNGGDLVIPPNVDLIEDFSNIKTNKQYNATLSSEELAAIRKQEIADKGLFAKTTYDAAHTNSRFMSAQLANTMAFTPEARRYFTGVYMKELAAMQDPSAVIEKLFSGDDLLSQDVRRDITLLNSTEAQKRIHSYIDSLNEHIQKGDVLLPEGEGNYSMISAWLPDVINRTLVAGGKKLTSEQEAASLKDDVAYFLREATEVGLARNPATVNGNVEAVNKGADEYFKTLAKSIGVDENALYVDPSSVILQRLQGADEDGDTALVYAIKHSANRVFADVMKATLVNTAEQYKKIRERANLTDEEIEKRAASQTDKVDLGGQQSFSLNEPKDLARFWLEGRKGVLGMGAASAVTRNAFQLGISDRVAKAVLMAEKNYDINSTRDKTARVYLSSADERAMLSEGAPISSIMNWAMKSRTLDENDKMVAFDQEAFNREYAEKIAKSNFTSVNSSTGMQHAIAIWWAKNVEGADVSGGFDWDSIFANLPQEFDKDSAAGQLSARLNDLRKQYIQGDFLVFGEKLEAELKQRSTDTYNEIRNQVNSDKSISEKDRSAEIARRYKSAGGEVVGHILQYGLTESNLLKNAEAFADVQSIVDIFGKENVYGSAVDYDSTYSKTRVDANNKQLEAQKQRKAELELEQQQYANANEEEIARLQAEIAELKAKDAEDKANQHFDSNLIGAIADKEAKLESLQNSKRAEIDQINAEIAKSESYQKQAFEFYRKQGEYERIIGGAEEFSRELWKSRRTKEAYINNVDPATLYYNKQSGIANAYIRQLNSLLEAGGLDPFQEKNVDKQIRTISQGVEIDFMDKSISNAKHLAESLSARQNATSIDYDKSEHELDGYIKKLKEATDYQNKLLGLSQEAKENGRNEAADNLAEAARQTGEYIDTGYRTVDQLRHNLYTQDISGEDKMITRLQRFTRDRNRRYSQSAFERQMLVNENDYEQYEQQYEAIAHRLSIWQSRRRGLAANGQIDTENYKLATQEINRLSSALSDCQKEMDSLSGINGKLNAGLVVTGQAAARVIEQFGRRMFHQAIQEARRFVVEYDSAMTEIQMVTLKTDEEMASLGDDFIDKAIDLKKSISDVTTAATALYRQGLSDEAVDERLSDIIKFQTVANVKTEDATKLITVALSGGMVDSAEDAMDVISALGDSAATTAGEITKGLQKSMYAAKEVGVTYEELVAMLTVITSKTQLSGSVAGTTMQTVLSRLARVGSSELIYDENGKAISGSEQARVLRSIGIETYDEGMLRSPFEILSELGKVWEDLEDASRNQISYALAGTRQYSNFSALMSGFSEKDENGTLLMDKYLGIAEESSGITNEKYLQYTDSLASNLTDVKNSFDGFVNSIAKADDLNGFLTFLSDALKGLTQFNEQLNGAPSKIVLLGTALAGLVGIFNMHNPLLFAAVVAISSLASIGKILNDTGDNLVSYNDRVSSVEQSYSTSKAALQNAQRLNKTRDSDGTLSSGNFNELKNALVQLNSLGFISIDASSSIDELARSASKTAEALDNASVSITQSEQKKKWAAAASSANDYKTSYINEAQKNADNPDPYSGLTLALSQANKNPHVMYTEAVRSFVKKMDSAGYLDLVTLEDGKIWSNLENKWSYRGDKYNYALSGDANLVAKLLELANTPEVMDQTKYISTPFGETQRGTVRTMFADLYGDDDTGIVDLATDIVVRQMTSAYETDSQFLPSQYMIDPFVGIDGEFDLRKFHSFVQSNAPKEYDKILQTTAEKNRAAAQKTPIQKMGPIVSGAVAADTSNYGDAYVNIADIVRTAPGATTGERISNITKAMNTVVPNWAAIFTDKENLDLAKTFNELLVYDENIKDFVPNESADQSVFDALLRILYGKDKRTSEIGTYRPQNVVAASAQQTFNRLTAEGVDAENVWRNLSDVTEINSLTQEELISILGKDLTASLINGQLDKDGLAYAQSLIDKAAVIASVAPSDTAKDVQNMITALMGTSSEQMKQFSTLYDRDESLSHGMYAYNRIAVTGGTESDFATLGEAIGLDAETVKRLSSTDEGKKLLEDSLNNQISTFSSTLSDALIAMLPDPSILATMSGFDSNQIAEALSGTLSEGALSIIQMLGGRIRNGEFVFDVDAMSTLKTPGQAHYNVMKELNENNPEFRMYEAMADSIEGISKWGGTFDSFLSQYAATKDEDWEDFYRNNPSIAARKSAYDAGQISSDEFYNFIRAEQYGNSEKDADYYDPALRMLLGENYKDGVSDWDAVRSNYETMMSTPVGQQFIEDIKELEGGSVILTELSDSMGDASVNGERCGEALNLVSNGLNSKAITQALKYDRALSKVQSTMKSLSDEGEDAAMATLDLYETTRNLSNASWALDKYQSGDRSDKVTGILSKQFSIDQTDLKKAADDQATAYYEAMHAAYEDRVAILKENFAQNFSDISSYINDFQSATGTEFDIGNYVVNGRVDVSALLKAFSEAGVIVDQTWAAVITAMAGAGATFTVGADGNSLSLDVSNLSTGGGKYYGGGSGGSKKSSADKLVERLGHGESLFDHQIKMVQYEQTKYENADELGNYGKMLEEEIKIERAYLPVLQSNIAALRSELANVKEGSEDWYKLRDAILEAEEKYADINNTIAENEKKLEENHQAILKLHTDLEEMVVGEIELRIDAEKEMLDGSVSMQDTILNAIKDRYRDEWDLIKQDIEKKKEALQQEKDLIDERLDARRDAEDEAAKYEELAELKKQLSLISMDSTRTKDAAALRESIAELEKEIGWDIAEKEAENEKNSIQDQIDAYDDYIAKGDEDLETLLEDANNFSEEVNGVLKLGQSELFEWLKQNVKEYANSLDDAQKQMVQSWEATYKQMLGITDTYWTEVNAILSSKDTFLNYMKQSNEYIYASDDERAQLLYQWEEAYDKWTKAQKNDADYNHSDSGLGSWNGSEYTGGSSSGSSGGGSGGSSNSGSTSGGSIAPSPTSKYGIYDDDGRHYGWATTLSDAMGVARSVAKNTNGNAYITDATGKTISTCSPNGSFKNSSSSSSSSGSSASMPETGWPASSPNGQTGKYFWKVTVNGVNKEIDQVGSTSRKAAQDAGAKAAAKYPGGKYTTKYYLEGGIADFTGLAWLDGTKERPERILNAQQTASFDELVEILDDLRNAGITTDILRDMMDWSTMVSIPSQLSYIGNDAYRGNIANIGDIHVTVQEAQINDDRDIDDLAEIVGQKFVKEISKQGFNIAHYNF